MISWPAWGRRSVRPMASHHWEVSNHLMALRRSKGKYQCAPSSLTCKCLRPTQTNPRSCSVYMRCSGRVGDEPQIGVAQATHRLQLPERFSPKFNSQRFCYSATAITERVFGFRRSGSRTLAHSSISSSPWHGMAEATSSGSVECRVWGHGPGHEFLMTCLSHSIASAAASSSLPAMPSAPITSLHEHRPECALPVLVLAKVTRTRRHANSNSCNATQVRQEHEIPEQAKRNQGQCLGPAWPLRMR